MSLNPFSAYTQILDIRVDDVPVVVDNLHFFEVIGSDFWICLDIASMQSCVSRTDSSRVSPWFFNPSYAVQALQVNMELEADNVLAA
jgi:hypothetical protein